MTTTMPEPNSARDNRWEDFKEHAALDDIYEEELNAATSQKDAKKAQAIYGRASALTARLQAPRWDDIGDTRRIAARLLTDVLRIRKEADAVIRRLDQ